MMRPARLACLLIRRSGRTTPRTEAPLRELPQAQMEYLELGWRYMCGCAHGSINLSLWQIVKLALLACALSVALFTFWVLATFAAIRLF
jgi:hypothetical protein